MKKWYKVTFIPAYGVSVITLAEDEETAKMRTAKTAHEEILKGLNAVCEEYDIFDGTISDLADEGEPDES